MLAGHGEEVKTAQAEYKEEGVGDRIQG